jgi:hypothetical protein
VYDQYLHKLQGQNGKFYPNFESFNMKIKKKKKHQAGESQERDTNAIANGQASK